MTSIGLARLESEEDLHFLSLKLLIHFLNELSKGGITNSSFFFHYDTNRIIEKTLKDFNAETGKKNSGNINPNDENKTELLEKIKMISRFLERKASSQIMPSIEAALSLWKFEIDKKLRNSCVVVVSNKEYGL